MEFLRNKFVRILTVVLLLQAAVFYATASRPELMPATRPLQEFPADSPGWRTVQDIQVEQEVLDVLKADDTLNRVYVDAAQTQSASLFVAFFKTQRSGQAPHSPKNCLPGSGWEPSETGLISVSVPDRPAPLLLNRYVVSRGDQKSVVLYWYQSHNRVIASEYWAKFWLVADSVRHRRSDTALVRVVIPVRGSDSAAATEIAVRFVQSIFPALERQLPS